MCTTADHEAIKDDPARLAATTTNPRPQHDEDGRVMFVVRDCASCQSTIAVTVVQDWAARWGVSDTPGG